MTQSSHILLTGGTGFFGRALLRHWLNEANQCALVPQITILTRSPDAFLSRHTEFLGLDWLHFHKGDILDPSSLPIGQSFTHILHAATDSTLGPQLTPLQRYIQITDGTRNMLDFAVTSGAKRFLLTSSGGVYGPQPQGMEKIPEHYNGIPDPLDPVNAYSVAKRSVEHLCVLYHDAHGIEPVIARCFSFVGQDLPLSVHFAIGNFVRDALWENSINVGGDGTPVRSYLDQTDLAAWLMVMLENGQACRAYNLGSDESITIAELAHLVREVIAPNKTVTILGKPENSNNRNRYIPDVTRARNELGLNITVHLREAIEHMAASINKKKR